MLLLGTLAWVLIAVFVCSLGRAAKVGDREAPRVAEPPRAPGEVRRQAEAA